MAKLSFDFDNTLTKNFVENFAEKLVKDGHEVWVVTKRYEFIDHDGYKTNNDDLFCLAFEIGIPFDKIHFCNGTDKSIFLKDKGFLWHLDDDVIELSFIRSDTNVFPIWRYNGNDWFNQCKDLIRLMPKLV